MEAYDLFIKLLDDDMLNFNAILIKNYKKLNIDEKDIIVLSMLSRQEVKGYHSFAPSRLKPKVGLSDNDFYNSLDHLTKKGYLQIKVEINPKTQKEGEYFYLNNLYKKIVNIYLQVVKDDEDKKSQSFEEQISNLYDSIFLKQMTPLEAEIITKWSQEKQFSFDEIRNEMLNAAKIGKTNLKYVDSSLIKSKMIAEQNPEYLETSKVIDELKEKWKK